MKVSPLFFAFQSNRAIHFMVSNKQIVSTNKFSPPTTT